MTSIGIYNFVLRILGLRMELLDFNLKLSPIGHTGNAFTKQLFKLVSIVIGITFAVTYPTETASIVSKTPRLPNGKMSVEYFIAFTFFYIKYIVTVIIFVLQFWKEHQISNQQTEIKQIFQRLWEINQYLLNKRSKIVHKYSLRLASLLNLRNRRQPVTRINLNIFNRMHLIRMFVTILIRSVSCYLEYYQIFERIIRNKESSFHLIWFSYPTVFIDFFIWHLSISVQQHIKLFELLDQTINSMAIDMRQHCIANEYRIENEQNEHIRKMETLIGIHYELCLATVKLQQLYAIQINLAILNSFGNIIIEVRITYLFVILCFCVCSAAKTISRMCGQFGVNALIRIVTK